VTEAAAMASSSPGLVPPKGGEPQAATGAEGEIRPLWLRPATIFFVLALHAAAALFIVAHVMPLVPLDGIEVTLLPLGDSAEDRPQLDEVKAAEAPAPAPAPAEPIAPEPGAPQPVAPDETVPELAAPPPQVVAPEAAPLPVAKPLPKPVEKPKKKPVVEKAREETTPAPSREQRRQQAEAAERRKAQAGQQASRRGSPQGQAQASGMSPGAYAALLAAEVARHKVYPAAARAAQATGSVGVTFTVGASGRVVSHSITRSSGNSALDAAVHAMMAAVHAPPPPGGVFRSSTNINFSLH
jgi:protein TonB